MGVLARGGSSPPSGTSLKQIHIYRTRKCGFFWLCKQIHYTFGIHIISVIMKNYIIAWVPLAWKSTLSNYIHEKYWVNHIPTDMLTTAFENVYPKLWITHDFWLSVDRYNRVCKYITPFLCSMINALNEESTYSSYCIEWCHRDLTQLKPLAESHTVIVLWYPTSSVEEKFTTTRKYDTDNRTNYCSDEDLKNIIVFRISVSTSLQKKAEELWFTYIDTNLEREKIFEV